MSKQANISGNKPPDLAPDDAADLVRPPGRPKGSQNRATKAIREIAQKYTRRAVLRCWKLAKDADNQDVQLKALQLLLAYGHGRPVDRQEVSGADGVPLHPPLTEREQARRIALILTRPGSGGEGIVAELMEGSSGESMTHSARGEDMAVGETPALLGPSASSPARPNGADDAGAEGGGGPRADRGARESTQHPVSEFQNNFSKKPAPKTEPEVGDTAYLGGYQVEVAAPSREGLPPRYLIRDLKGSLLSQAQKGGGWEGACAWIRKHIGGELDMSELQITAQTPDAWGDPTYGLGEGVT